MSMAFSIDYALLSLQRTRASKNWKRFGDSPPACLLPTSVSSFCRKCQSLTPVALFSLPFHLCPRPWQSPSQIKIVACQNVSLGAQRAVVECRQRQGGLGNKISAIHGAFTVCRALAKCFTSSNSLNPQTTYFA